MLDRGGRPTERTTGRFVAVLAERSAVAVARLLEGGFGLSVAAGGDLAAGGGGMLGADAVLFERLGIAVVAADPERTGRLAGAATAAGGAILSLEPERVVYPAGQGGPAPGDPFPEDPPADDPAPSFADDERRTWGLQAVGVPAAGGLTGRGAAVAVLDTGLDGGHPDFAGRDVDIRSFVDGEAAHDGNGHGTHCAGVAVGPSAPAQGPRYGVAPDAALLVGKVLSDAGVGSDSSVLAGIEWAVASGCRIVSMSLGAAVEPGERHNLAFEVAGQRALQAGTVLVAAAGNDSARDRGTFAPVGHPANCPTILAVAALDPWLSVARFSNGDADGDGAVDVAAPGVDVRSSWPVADGSYLAASGTSMATPHAAGVLGLLAGQRPQATPYELITALLLTARRLEQASTAVGVGLVRAPG